MKRYARLDVFDRLKSRGTLDAHQHEAVRRLERDVAARAGLGSPEQTLEVVDHSGSADASKQAFKQYQVDAGIRVDEVLYATGPCNALLLRALIDPGVLEGRAVAWRTAVERVMGEKREES